MSTLFQLSGSADGGLSQSGLIEAVGWALCHFVWQGTLVALTLAVALRLLARRSAGARYGVCLTALTLLAALPVVTAVWCYSPDGREREGNGSEQPSTFSSAEPVLHGGETVGWTPAEVAPAERHTTETALVSARQAGPLNPRHEPPEAVPSMPARFGAWLGLSD